VYGVGWRRAARSRGASGYGTQQSLSERTRGHDPDQLAEA